MLPSALLAISSTYLQRIDTLGKNDIHTLRDIVVEHNILYYQRESPIISDTEYDILYRALEDLEKKYDMQDISSPTYRLAISASAQFQKVAHIYPMISLENTYSREDIHEWDTRIQRGIKNMNKDPSVVSSRAGPEISGYIPERGFEYYVQPKYDGLGLAVVYVYGRYTQAITRGSGVEGEDVTLTAYEISNIPKYIPALAYIPRMEVRGEVIMSRTSFRSVNAIRMQNGEKLFANPRNCASGSLRQLDPAVTKERNLAFLAYSIPQVEMAVGSEEGRMKNEEYIGERISEISPLRKGVGGIGSMYNGEYTKEHIQNISPSTYSELMDILGTWGFVRVDFAFRYIHGLESLLHTIQNETDNRKEYFDYEIDGMVIKLDDMRIWSDLGRTEHHPRYAIAYKFPPTQVRTHVLSIEHSVARTGTITPVAELEPVDVGGVVVRRATLHNYDELAKKGVRIGDYVYVVRAGEVIPEIVSVIESVRTGTEVHIDVPTLCPVCATAVCRDDGKVAIYCPNIHCPAKIQGQIEMAVSKVAMNIDGLGTRQIELFLEKGYIVDLPSVYMLEKYRADILGLDGYKEKSVENLLSSIEKSRYTTLDRVLVALCIPNIGRKTAKQIANLVYSIWGNSDEGRVTGSENIVHILFSLTVEDMLQVADIGPETAHSYVQYMVENRHTVERLFGYIHLPDTRVGIDSTGDKNTNIYGKSFCVTGTYSTYSREDIHTHIESMGGVVRSSVSTKLDYLICGENAGSKREKAIECGVKIVSIQEWESMMGM